jgi:hypothetical protein
MRSTKSFLLIFLLLAGIPGFTQLIRDKATLENMSVSLAKQKELASGRSRQLFDVFSRPMRPDERQALEYLYAYMPLSDLADYTGEYFAAQVKATLLARNEMPWGLKIPEDIFLHFVLPVRVNNENLDNFRVQIYDELKLRIKGMNMHDAALEINHWCHEKVTYKASDERTSSPLATIQTSFGRCGEESTFTVSAMRAVGIPSRQVYTPRWAHCDDNHAWVEVWVDGKWYFLGACEPEAELNMGWFAGPAMRAMLVHTRAYGWYNSPGEVIDRQEKFSELNLITGYAQAKPVTVRVLDQASQPAMNAQVEYQLYNYAEFYPIAKGKTNEYGFSSITSGLGDLLIWASSNGHWDYRKITVENTDTITLQLGRKLVPGFTETFDLIPPIEKDPPVTNLSGDAKAINSLRLLQEDSIRTAYMGTFRDSAWSWQLADRLRLDPVKVTNYIKLSYGNWQEIAGFLESVKPEHRSWALHLLGAISAKDLRDTKQEILFDHLETSLANASPELLSDTSNFVAFVMSGRILNEMMLPWRGFLQQQFTREFTHAVRNDIAVLTDWIRQQITINDVANLHSRAPLSPRGVFELKVADSRSRDIFFVALCRCMGIPSRINSATYIPQYWMKGEWKNISFEPTIDKISEKGFIHFSNGNPSINPKYAINFTVARCKDGVYRTVDFDFEKTLSDFPEKVEVETGSYYLVTGNRQPDGSILASLTFFAIENGKTTNVSVAVREVITASIPWGHLDLRNFSLEEYPARNTRGLKSLVGNGAILIWIDPDREPTKHVMSDLSGARTVLEKWMGNVIFLLRDSDPGSSFNPAGYQDLPSRSLFMFDTGNKLIREITKLREKSNEVLMPVVVLCDAEGKLYYYSEGYKIGIGEQLAKEVNTLK